MHDPIKRLPSPRRVLAALALVPAVLLGATGVSPAASPSPGPSQSPEGDITGEWPLQSAHFDAQKIWALTRGQGITVAVVDSGVAANHPDLTGQVLPGTSLLGDGDDGRTDTSSESHGTAIAALIAGTGASAHGKGIIGLAPDAKILPVRVTSGSQVTAPLLAQGIIWAADHGAQIINVSIGSPTPDPLLKQAVAYAGRKDAVVVASAGNNGQTGNEMQYPAGFPGVVAVSGTDQNHAFWPTSASGPDITVAAPAAQIASAGDNGQYVQADGTSYAAGYVSAALALIRSHNPHLTAGQAIAALISTTRDHHAVPDDQLGYGEIDPLAALTAPPAASTTNPLLAPRPTAPTASPTLWAGLGVSAVVLLAAGGVWLWWRRTRPRRPTPGAAAPRPAAGERPRNGAKKKGRPTSNASATAPRARSTSSARRR
ncbi:S8 family serine peptidase [Streptacidiphilus sp. N1-12]|uniref:S8 family serine peptidase n=2 Tax=Streptacidiphilus alkalitolerans TaxID=3342712 RepID=A0ABV6VHE2_9ACTN